MREPLHTLSVSPREWGLKPSLNKSSDQLTALGLDAADLENRARQNTYQWLMRQFNEEIGAFHGYYDPRSRTFNEPQTVNLIAPFQLLAAFDRYQDEMLLDKAKRCADWLEAHFVENHPMSFVFGGVRDNIRAGQLWTKYTADYMMQNLALYTRTAEEVYFHRAQASGKFLLQAQYHDFACKYDHSLEEWVTRGWQSFGRVILALMAMEEVTGEQQWLDWATDWADYALAIQWGDGCFYLINDTYYNSDIAADEIRGLFQVYRATGRDKYLKSAQRYAEWHVERQRGDGAWWLSVDRNGITVNEYVGPGDVPNIAISMLMAHQETGRKRYFDAAVHALQYSLTTQATPDSGDPYLDDPNVVWGFWSWDPYYDYTMSADQSTHHVRGYWFFLDYFFSLPEQIQDERTSPLLKEDGREAVKPLPGGTTGTAPDVGTAARVSSAKTAYRKNRQSA